MAVETARPAIAAERVGQHLEQAGRLLAVHQADGLFVFRDTNILAFFGVPLAPSDRLVCGLLNRYGQVVLIVPAFEAGMVGALPPGGRLLTWEEQADPYALVAEAAGQLGITSGTILLDGHTWIQTQARLCGVLPSATLRPDPGVIESVRMTKSPEEVMAIQSACRDTGKIYPLIAKHLRAGLSELALSTMVLAELRLSGLAPRGELIQGGENASVPHRPPGARTFEEGDAVIVDFVCAKDGYLGDMSRTFAVGEPTGEIRRAYAVVREAQRVAIAAVRPGATCESVDAAARAVIDRAGLADAFTHRLGHGIGLDVHEPPYLVQGNQQRLEPGMCITIEPGIYVPGSFGIRIEDVVAVTDDGCEVLSGDTPTDVSEIFA